MLLPAKVKFRKMHRLRGKQLGVSTTKLDVSFGQYGLKALEGGLITGRQIEAARRAMTRFVKRGGKIWIRVFPDQPVTSHGNEQPMGGGKGAVDHYVAVIRSGVVMFEMDGVTEEIARQAMNLAAYKMPVKTKFVTRH